MGVMVYSGIFLMMGNAGFISSTVPIILRTGPYSGPYQTSGMETVWVRCRSVESTSRPSSRKTLLFGEVSQAGRYLSESPYTTRLPSATLNPKPFSCLSSHTLKFQCTPYTLNPKPVAPFRGAGSALPGKTRNPRARLLRWLRHRPPRCLDMIGFRV